MPRATRRSTLPDGLLLSTMAATPAAPKKSAALFQETVFDQFLGMMGRIPDPDEVLKKAGIKRENLRMLEADDDLVAALDTRREAVLGTPWRLEPGGTEQAEWIEFELRPVIEDAIRCALQAVPYGYSVGEIIYAQRETGRLGIKSVVEKPFEWFAPKPDGSLVWFSQTAPDGELVEPVKFMLTVRQFTYRNPYGEALFSRLYWPWFFRKNGWMFWAKWLERFGQPLLVGKTRANYEKMAKDLHAAVQGASLAIHSDDSVDAIDVTGTGQQFVEFEQHIIKRYQRSILGQTLTSDVGDSGSYAAASVHNEVREDKRNADLRMVRRSLQRLVDNLWILNAFPDLPPEFIMADETGLEEKRAERDARLVDAGILRLTEEYLLDRYDFREGDFVVNEPTQPPTQAPTPPSAEGMDDDMEEAEQQHGTGETFARRPAAAGGRFTKGQQAVEDLVASSLGQLGPLVSQAAILRCIRLSTSPEDLMERLALLFDDESASPRFRHVFEQALFAAEIMGYAHAEDPEALKRFAAPVVNVTAQFEPPPAPSIIVNVPEQPAPVVNVAAPELPAPIVNVTAEAAAPIVNVTAEVKPRLTETIIERDTEGNIVKATQADIPDERTLN